MRAARFGRIVFVSSRAALGWHAHRLLGHQGRRARHGAHLGARAGARGRHGQRGRDRPRGTDIFHEVVPRDDAARIDRIARASDAPLGAVDDVSRAVLFFASPTTAG
jgi:hypothetical protein